MKRRGHDHHAVRSVAIVVVLTAALALLTGCPDLFGPQNNPADPEAENYQGYDTVDSIDDVGVVTDGQTAHAWIPTVAVTPSADATGYEILVEVQVDGEWRTAYEHLQESHEFDLGGAELGAGAYRYSIRAHGSGDEVGSWTPHTTLVVEALVTGLSPTNGAVVEDTSPTFSWNATDGAASYQFRIAESGASLSEASIVEVSGTSHTVQVATNNTTFVWQVRSINAEGLKSAWTSESTLTVGWGAIAGMSPVDSASVTDTTPLLGWDPIDGAAGYVLQIAESEDGVADATIIVVSTTTYTPSDPLTNSTTYYWRVRGIDEAEVATAWSSILSFSVSWGAVSGLTPADEAWSTDTTPELSWTAVDGAVSYEVQIAATEAELDATAAQVSAATTFTPATALSNNTLHFWRVRAKDGDGQYGAWSAENALTIGWGAITGMTPADISTLTDTTPTLGWDAVDGAATYEVQLADTYAGVDQATAAVVTAAEYTPPDALTNLSTYYWRARAVDGGGQATAWSVIREFTIEWGAVTGLLPADSSTTDDTTPSLSWNVVPGAASYEIEIADSEADLNGTTVAASVSAGYTPGSALLNNQTHYWRVRAKDGDGQYGNWSDASGITVAWGEITGMAPADGSTTNDTTPDFTWDAVTGAATYEIEIADTETALDGTTVATSPSATYTPSSALSNNQTHYWRIRAKDADDQYGNWSTPQSLTISWGAITGMSPADASTIADTTPTLGWDVVDGAVSYEVQVADSEAGVDGATAETVTTEAYTPSAGLSDETTHYWRIRAINGDGEPTAWSSIISFTIACEQAETPYFSSTPGDYGEDLAFYILCDTSDAVIHYTTDGSDPTIDSPVYPEGHDIFLSGFGSTMTVKAIAVGDELLESAIAVGEFAIVYNPLPTPVIAPSGGNVEENTAVSISCDNPEAVIAFSTDGSEPTGAHTWYTDPIILTETGTQTIRAIAFLNQSEYSDSDIATAVFEVGVPAPSPVIDPAGGTYQTELTVDITCSDPAASIHYTLDGSDPTAASSLYAGAFTVSALGTHTIRAIALKEGFAPSEIVESIFTIEPPQASHVIDFEDQSLEAVSFTGDGVTLNADPSYVHQGSYSLRISGKNSDGSSSGATITGPVSPTDEVELSFYVYLQSLSHAYASINFWFETASERYPYWPDLWATTSGYNHFPDGSYPQFSHSMPTGTWTKMTLRVADGTASFLENDTVVYQYSYTATDPSEIIKYVIRAGAVAGGTHNIVCYLDDISCSWDGESTEYTIAEEFSDQVIDEGWTVELNNATYSLEDGAFRTQIPKPEGSDVSTCNLTWNDLIDLSSDFTLDVRLRQSGYGGSRIYLSKNDDSSQQLRFSIDTDDFAYLSYRKNSTETTVESSASYLGDFHRYQIEKQGSVYTFSVDNVVKGSFTHTELDNTDGVLRMQLYTAGWKTGPNDVFIDYVRLD